MWYSRAIDDSVSPRFTEWVELWAKQMPDNRSAASTERKKCLIGLSKLDDKIDGQAPETTGVGNNQDGVVFIDFLDTVGIRRMCGKYLRLF